MSSDKLTRKEIRNPDAFVRVTSVYWAKMVEHRKAAGIAAVVVLALLVAMALVTRSREAKVRDSASWLATALELAQREVDFGPTDRPAAAGQEPKFKTFKEKNEALEKAFLEVQKQHPGTSAARTALFFAGNAQFQLGKLDEATKSYQEYLAGTQPGDVMLGQVHESLGYVYEAKKELDKAQEAFQAMSKEAVGAPDKARAAYHCARIMEEQGKKQEAATAFAKLKENFKDAPAANQAEQRLALLAMQGITPISAEASAR